MHILITTPTFPPQTGGVAEVAWRQREYLLSRGHTVEVISASADGPVDEVLGVYRLDVRSGGFPTYAAGDRWGISNQSAKSQYLELLSTSQAQIILSHCWQAWNTDWAFEHLSMIAKPIGIFSHGTSVNTLGGWLGPIRFLRWREYAWRTIPKFLKSAAVFFMLEQYVDKDRFLDGYIASKLGIKPIIIPNGCTPTLLHNSEVAIADRNPQILCVTQYTKAKNPIAVVDAFVSVDAPGWRLVVCGSHPTPYYTALRQKVDNLPLPIRSRISLEVGLSRDAIYQLYQESEIVVSTSITECQPLVLIDAMGAGVPFISTRVGSVEAMQGGIVVDSISELIGAIQRLINDNGLRRSLGQAGRQAALQKYNWEQSMNRLEVGLIDTVNRRGTSWPAGLKTNGC